MPNIQRSAIVNCSAAQMYALVNDINDYQNFLPWCSESYVASQTDNEMIASLKITWMGFTKQFTTKNHLTPPKEIQLSLVEGPFHALQGLWGFNPISNTQCEVNLTLEFEFTRNLLDKVFQPIFNNIANSMVDAFRQRAEEIYAK